ncbi:hypothetical protein A2U01_0066120, partial [Trifolium medium]|nr:hypothetical protein [Trifolium medium]
RMENSLDGPMEEMLRAGGRNLNIEMNDVAKEGGTCRKRSDVQVSISLRCW